MIALLGRLVSCLGIVLALQALATPVLARTIHVAPSGGDYDSLSVALFAATDGDTVAIAAGTYVEDWDRPEVVLVEHKRLTVMGNASMPETVTVTGFRISFRFCEGTRIEGIRFYRNPGPIFIYAGYATLADCLFEENQGRYQCGALSIGWDGGGDALVQRCQFVRNEGCHGAGIYSGGRHVFAEDCLFYDNRASGTGGAIWTTGKLEAYRCAFLSNRAQNGAAVNVESGQLEMEHCTLWNNHVTGTGAAVHVKSDKWSVDASIIARTHGGLGIWCEDYGFIRCCNFWENEGGVASGCEILESEGNIFEDPLFCDLEVGDVGLKKGSPCLRETQNDVLCEQIGAFGAECEVTPVAATTWGRLKNLYRHLEGTDR